MSPSPLPPSALLGSSPSPGRFRGWTRPGPVPPGAGSDEPQLQPGPDETLDWLCGHTRIFQLKKGHRFSVDDVLVGHWGAAWAPRVERALDLGSGIGSVALTVAWRLPGAKLATVEAQEVSIALARRSIAFNGWQDRITPHHFDLRDTARLLEVAAAHGPFDLVTGSPPYWPVGAALPSAHAQAVPARLEVRGDVGDYAAAARAVLAPGGVFAAVHQASQDARVRARLKEGSLALIRTRAVRFIEHEPAERSGIRLYLCMRPEDVPRGFVEGRPGKPVEEPDLVLRRTDGSIHPDYAALRLAYGFPPGDADPDER